MSILAENLTYKSTMIRIFPFIFIILWSSAFITTKPIIDHSDPFAALAFRFFFVALGFLIFAIYKNQKTEIGYLLSPKYWSNGYGTEADNYLCEYLFKNKNVKIIIASIDTRNLISIKFRSHYFHLEGVFLENLHQRRLQQDVL